MLPHEIRSDFSRAWLRPGQGFRDTGGCTSQNASAQSTRPDFAGAACERTLPSDPKLTSIGLREAGTTTTPSKPSRHAGSRGRERERACQGERRGQATPQCPPPR